MSIESKQTARGSRAMSLTLKIGTATLCRLVLNTARRFPYPFAPVLSRGLGVSLPAVTSLIAVNQATALLGVFSGPLADRIGYRLMMLSGLGLLVLGMFAAGFLPFYGVVMTALFLAGLGKCIFDPALQAYVSARVPFHRRGLVIGVLEFSWAGSTLVGIPLVALVIDRFGWRAPFFLLGGVGLLGMLAIPLLLPAKEKITAPRDRDQGFRSVWGRLLQERAAVGSIGFAFFVSVANDNLFVVYGAWLERNFQLSILALGAATSIIGIAEFAGEAVTAFFADRLGLKRSVLTGLSLCALCYAALPLMGASLALALAGMFAIFLTFEFTIVTSLSLSTELLPEHRATMMSVFFAAAGIGRILGALLGGPVWIAGGIMATGLVSAVLSALGLISLVWGLWGWKKG